jgi:hypothetical protein
MTGIDEATCRRADWAEGEEFTLSNGQRWTFPVPTPVRGTSGPVWEAGGDRVAGEQYGSGAEAIRQMEGTESEEAMHKVYLRMMIDLLRRNYDVTREEAERLISPLDEGWTAELEGRLRAMTEALLIKPLAEMARLRVLSRSIFED